MVSFLAALFESDGVQGGLDRVMGFSSLELMRWRLIFFRVGLLVSLSISYVLRHLFRHWLFVSGCSFPYVRPTRFLTRPHWFSC